PSRATPRCCAPRPRAASPRTSTSTCCWSGRWPGSSSSPDCTPPPRPTRHATVAWSSGACRSCSSTATSPVSRPRSSPRTRRRRPMSELLGADEAELAELVSLALWFGVEDGAAAAGPLLDRGVTGFVCGSDLMALGVIRAARSRGLAVPDQVSVVGYDDSPLIAYTDPP